MLPFVKSRYPKSHSDESRLCLSRIQMFTFCIFSDFQGWHWSVRVCQVRGHEVRRQEVGRHQIQVARGNDLRT